MPAFCLHEIIDAAHNGFHILDDAFNVFLLDAANGFADCRDGFFDAAHGAWFRGDVGIFRCPVHFECLAVIRVRINEVQEKLAGQAEGGGQNSKAPLYFFGYFFFEVIFAEFLEKVLIDVTCDIDISSAVFMDVVVVIADEVDVCDASDLDSPQFDRRSDLKTVDRFIEVGLNCV